MDTNKRYANWTNKETNKALIHLVKKKRGGKAKLLLQKLKSIKLHLLPLSSSQFSARVTLKAMNNKYFVFDALKKYYFFYYGNTEQDYLQSLNIQMS